MSSVWFLMWFSFHPPVFYTDHFCTALTKYGCEKITCSSNMLRDYSIIHWLRNGTNDMIRSVCNNLFNGCASIWKTSHFMVCCHYIWYINYLWFLVNWYLYKRSGRIQAWEHYNEWHEFALLQPNSSHLHAQTHYKNPVTQSFQFTLATWQLPSQTAILNCSQQQSR